MAKSEFREWFVKQFGPRPGGRLTNTALIARWQAGQYAQRQLERRRDWDDAFDAALKGYICGIDRQNRMFARKRRKSASANGGQS